MADEKPSEEVVAPILAADTPWTRSPDYRMITSNAFRYRPGAGEVACSFATIIDGLPKATNTIEEQITVMMSFAHLKIVCNTLKMMVSAIEDIQGTILLPAASNDATEELARINFNAQLTKIYGKANADKKK